VPHEQESERPDQAIKDTRVNRRAAVISVVVALLAAACGRTITPEPTAGVVGSTGVPGVAPTATPRLTATGPILPPVDTPTPTLTPTPIIHVIESGDTLYSIAFDYGVNPDALQEANGIEDPRFLSIGQELIIPIDVASDDGTSNLLLPTPTPAPISIQGVGFYETPVGSLWCLGEISNTTGAPLANVQVRVLLFDARGELVAEEDAFAAAEIIPAGERSPFGILFTSPPPEWVNSQLGIVRGEAAGGLAAAFASTVTRNVTAEPIGDQLQVQGSVANGSDGQAVAIVTVIVTTYSDDGEVTGFRQRTLEPETPLGPGTSMPFAVRLSYHGQAPTEFHVLTIGRVPG
jgi:LysM repeat protein